MTAEAAARPAIQRVPPGLTPLLLQVSGAGVVALGDKALADPVARAGLGYWAHRSGAGRVWLWGRAADAHGDSFAELWRGLDGPAPRLTLSARFEAIDLILDAEGLAEAAGAAAPAAAFAALDPSDVLEARLLDELARHARLAAFSP